MSGKTEQMQLSVTVWANRSPLISLLVAIETAILGPLLVLAEWRVEPGTEWSEELRVWDPAPELNLSLGWIGERNAKNEAEGEGDLTWSDEQGPVSIYSGEMVAGKRQGDGTWHHRSGSKYVGSWMNNLKEGAGEYWLKNGDYYKGSFRGDKLEGDGLYVFADGAVYQGNFEGGNKQGSGTMTFPDGRIHQSIWEKDQDTNPPPPPSEPYLVLGTDPQVYALNGKVFNTQDAENSENDLNNVLTYRGRWTGKDFVINPDWPYWTTWSSGGPVGGLGHFYLGVHPVFLELRVYNPGQEKLSIASAEVEVQTSTPDMQPILEIGSLDYTRNIEISSFSARDVESVEVSYNLLPPGTSPKFGSYQFKETIPPFSGSVCFSIESSLQTVGIDTSLINEWEAAAADLQSANVPFEIGEARKKALLGKIRASMGKMKAFAKDSEHVVELEARFVGEMTVAWTDHGGTKQTTKVKVDFTKSFFTSGDEGGAGGPSSGRYDILLETDGSDYVRPFPYKRALEPGANDRFVLTIASNESSLQNFRVRLVTTDGREIISPPCRLQFLVPRGHDWNTGLQVLP